MSSSRQRARRTPAVVWLAGIMLAVTVLAWVVPAGLMPVAEAAPAAAPQTGGASHAQEFTQLADGTGRELTVGRCIICHSLEYIPSNAPAMNRAGWDKAIQKMRDRFGAPITDEESREILDYLAANYSGKP